MILFIYFFSSPLSISSLEEERLELLLESGLSLHSEFELEITSRPEYSSSFSKIEWFWFNYMKTGLQNDFFGFNVGTKFTASFVL